MNVQRPRVTSYAFRSTSSRPGVKARGFTLVELLIVISIIAILAVIAVPMYLDRIEEAHRTRAIHEVRDLCTAICAFEADSGAYPTALTDLGQSTPVDPWGNQYQYLVVAGANIGQLRKDQFLVPLNTDFDLYSMGLDGATVMPLTAPASQDDIIRANDGQFIGLGSEY
jgi:general secretion pathway protein G